LNRNLHHHHLGTFFPAFNDFQDSLMPQAGAADMSQQQEAVSEQPAQPPTIKVRRRAKKMPQDSLSLDSHVARN
jgi:hypothetical protein